MDFEHEDMTKVTESVLRVIESNSPRMAAVKLVEFFRLGYLRAKELERQATMIKGKQ